jgi:hypothetical protein
MVSEKLSLIRTVMHLYNKSVLNLRFDFLVPLCLTYQSSLSVKRTNTTVQSLISKARVSSNSVNINCFVSVPGQSLRSDSTVHQTLYFIYLYRVIRSSNTIL